LIRGAVKKSKKGLKKREKEKAAEGPRQTTKGKTCLLR